MPRGDGTGPMGRGAMTGRCMGFCIKEIDGGKSPSTVGKYLQRRKHAYGRGLCGLSNDATTSGKETFEKKRSFLLSRIKRMQYS
ncbi:MAG: DUF5320 domain-containing protein [Synergistaceae bacterium]|nr:DUF5320 domain-containing protein [Synergistaceae bacterium]